MIKKKYVRRAYIEIPHCNKCGDYLVPTGNILCKDLAEYKCRSCHYWTAFSQDEIKKFSEIQYEFEEAECDV